MTLSVGFIQSELPQEKGGGRRDRQEDRGHWLQRVSCFSVISFVKEDCITPENTGKLHTNVIFDHQALYFLFVYIFSVTLCLALKKIRPEHFPAI